MRWTEECVTGLNWLVAVSFFGRDRFQCGQMSWAAAQATRVT